MLSIRVDGRRRVVATAHDRGPSHEGGSMIDFLLMNGKLLESKTERAN
jgi:hypothetical protein